MVDVKIELGTIASLFLLTSLLTYYDFTAFAVLCFSIDMIFVSLEIICRFGDLIKKFILSIICIIVWIAGTLYICRNYVVNGINGLIDGISQAFGNIGSELSRLINATTDTVGSFLSEWWWAIILFIVVIIILIKIHSILSNRWSY